MYPVDPQTLETQNTPESQAQSCSLNLPVTTNRWDANIYF